MSLSFHLCAYTFNNIFIMQEKKHTQTDTCTHTRTHTQRTTQYTFRYFLKQLGEESRVDNFSCFMFRSFIHYVFFLHCQSLFSFTSHQLTFYKALREGIRHQERTGLVPSSSHAHAHTHIIVIFTLLTPTFYTALREGIGHQERIGFVPHNACAANSAL